MQLQLTGHRSSPIAVHKGLVLCSVFFETLNNICTADTGTTTCSSSIQPLHRGIKNGAAK